MSNNAAAREMRATALGRCNCAFAGSDCAPINFRKSPGDSLALDQPVNKQEATGPFDTDTALPSWLISQTLSAGLRAPLDTIPSAPGLRSLHLCSGRSPFDFLKRLGCALVEKVAAMKSLSLLKRSQVDCVRGRGLVFATIVSRAK
jgi:hypothetical protein